MPPPHPDGYFSPMMGPEEFLPGGRGLGPDGGGYSSPMTPHRRFSVGGMCPMEFQHSPHHHHHHHHHPPPGGHFPMPSPRMGFPPDGRPFPEPPMVTGPVSKPQRRKSGGMSKMVGKMKIKSPGQQRKKVPSPSSQGQEEQQQQEQSSPQQQQQQQQQEQQQTQQPQQQQQQQGKKRRSPGYSEAGWRCRCGTNNVMFPDKVCAKGKCPCYTKGVACKNCLCRHCHNPFGVRESSTSLPASAVIEEIKSEDVSA